MAAASRRFLRVVPERRSRRHGGGLHRRSDVLRRDRTRCDRVGTARDRVRSRGLRGPEGARTDGREILVPLDDRSQAGLSPPRRAVPFLLDLLESRSPTPMPTPLIPSPFPSVDAEDYDRLRHSYPQEAVDWLVAEAGLSPGALVLDAGAGTGQASDPLRRS